MRPSPLSVRSSPSSGSRALFGRLLRSPVPFPNTVKAPTRLLTRGPFAYVRNPLYLSAGALFVGLTTMYGLWQRRDAMILPIIGLLVHLFVVYREEPKTRERLGPCMTPTAQLCLVGPPLLIQARRACSRGPASQFG